MAKKTEWKRNCSECNEEIFYTRKYERKRAEKNNTKCRSCTMKSEEIRKKIGESLKGIKFSDERKKNISKNGWENMEKKKLIENVKEKTKK